MATSKEGKSHNKGMCGIWRNCLKSGLNIIWLNLESLDAERRRCASFHFCKQIAADLIHSFGMFFIFHPSVSFHPLQIQGKLFFWRGGVFIIYFCQLGKHSNHLLCKMCFASLEKWLSSSVFAALPHCAPWRSIFSGGRGQQRALHLSRFYPVTEIGTYVSPRPLLLSSSPFIGSDAAVSPPSPPQDVCVCVSVDMDRVFCPQVQPLEGDYCISKSTNHPRCLSE